jgi:hypothetical protein
MDDRRFDSLVRSLATGTSRRQVLRGIVGGAALGGALVGQRVDAARRGYAGVPVLGAPKTICVDNCCVACPSLPAGITPSYVRARLQECNHVEFCDICAENLQHLSCRQV